MSQEAIVQVKSCGTGLSFQDQGRHGYKRYGIAPAGWMDPYSAVLANQLVGNLENDCALECLIGGVELELLQDTWLAFCGGGECNLIPNWSARYCKKGETLRIKPSQNGLWSYLAIPGGWKASLFVKSTSKHSRSDIGDTIQVGDLLFAKDQLPCIETNTVKRYIPIAEQRTYFPCPPLKIYPGPHLELFDSNDREHFIKQTWQISSQSDRTGYRLEGIQIPHSLSLPSSPNLVGSIQITQTGQAIVTLNDGPTVGGYPVLALIDKDDLSYFVQQLPGTSVNFQWYE